VGGVAEANTDVVGVEADLLGTRGGNAGGISATEVVHEGGVGPVGLDGGVVVVHALVAGNRAVDAGVHGGDLVVVEPVLSSPIVLNVEGTCGKLGQFPNGENECLNTSTNCFRPTEVDVGIGGVGATNPGGAGNGAALVEGHELVEVVEIGEHLRNRPKQVQIQISVDRTRVIKSRI
jgi:hypothetical protein